MKPNHKGYRPLNSAKQKSSPPFYLLASGASAFLQRGDASFVKRSSCLVDLEIPGRERKSRSIVSLWFRALELSSEGKFETDDFSQTALQGGFWWDKNHTLQKVQLSLTALVNDEWSVVINATLADRLPSFDAEVSVVVSTKIRLTDRLDFIWQYPT